MARKIASSRTRGSSWNGRPTTASRRPTKSDDLSVAALTAAYKRWANNRDSREGVSIAGFKKVEMMMNRLATGPYGVTDARQFGPAQ